MAAQHSKVLAQVVVLQKDTNGGNGEGEGYSSSMLGEYMDQS
jgi:hypothetical protein